LTQPAARPAGVNPDRMPTFIMAGTGKSGSTTLYEYLRQHPQVCMSRTKEPRFFTRSTGFEDDGAQSGPTRSGRFDEGHEWYEDQFSECAGKQARGEATMMYFFAEDAPALIRSWLPDVRLIFLLRAPVARAYAQYWGERRHGWELPSSFEEMVANQHPRAGRYLETSRYSVHLERFFGCFDAEQIHIELFEDLVKDPAAVFQRVCTHIGVDPSFVPPAAGTTYNKGGEPRFGSVQRALRRMRRGSVRELIPERVRPIFNSLYRSVTAANTGKRGYPALDGAVRRRLTEQFENDIVYVERLLGRPLPEWRV